MASTSQQPTTTHGDEEEEEQQQQEEEEEEATSPEGGWTADGGGGSQLVMPEDGYEWKKYGQKFIKNIQKIRSYFRCRDKRCGAKKKVEWHPGDPSLRVVYDGAHQHGSASSSSSTAAANRYELSAQYFGGARAQQ